jgi:hypothetical protein
VAGELYNSDNEDFAVAMYNSAGVKQWVHCTNPSDQEDGARDIGIDDAGYVYAAGRIHLPPSDTFDFDYLTAKYGPGGTQLWSRRYHYRHDLDPPGDKGLAISVDGAGNVVTTGTSHSRVQDPWMAATVKYNASGGLLWVYRFSRGEKWLERPMEIIQDSSSNVLLFGEAESTGRHDWLVVKLSGGGSYQWHRTFTGPGLGYDVANSIAVDPLDYIYITGAINTGGDTTHCATMKLDAAGNLVWDRRVAEWSSGGDIALDPAGNVYVVGHKGDSTMVLKYDSDGNLLWSDVRDWYEATGRHGSYLGKLAIGPDGMPCMVGRVGRSPGTSYYMTMRYSEFDVGIASILRPVGEVDSGTVLAPACSVRNYGFRQADCQVNMDIGGSYSETVSITNLVRGETRCVEFPNWTAHPTGWHSVSCSTSVMYDFDSTNNYLRDSVYVPPGSGGIGSEPETRYVFRLDEVRPTPVTRRAEVVYSLPARARVALAVYSSDGRLVKTLVAGDVMPGNHRVTWNCTDERGRGVESGIYYARLVAGEDMATRKLVVQD